MKLWLWLWLGLPLPCPSTHCTLRDLEGCCSHWLPRSHHCILFPYLERDSLIFNFEMNGSSVHVRNFYKSWTRQGPMLFWLTLLPIVELKGSLTIVSFGTYVRLEWIFGPWPSIFLAHRAKYTNSEICKVLNSESSYCGMERNFAF
jgi:hypothetical protein